MNKQRKVVITTTYNEMGIIIDTKVEEVAQPNLQQTCNQLATDTISRQQAIDVATSATMEWDGMYVQDLNVRIREAIEKLPPIQPEIVRCKDCKHWIPYDWMFNEVWRSKNIADYPEDEIGCNLSDMAMKANDFCSRGKERGDGMSYIVPRDRPKICDECPFSAYSMTHNGLMCTLEENIVIVDRNERYAFCRLIDIDNGALFDKERARRYLRTDLPTDNPIVREVTE